MVLTKDLIEEVQNFKKRLYSAHLTEADGIIVYYTTIDCFVQKYGKDAWYSIVPYWHAVFDADADTKEYFCEHVPLLREFYSILGEASDIYIQKRSENGGV